MVAALNLAIITECYYLHVGKLLQTNRASWKVDRSNIRMKLQHLLSDCWLVNWGYMAALCRSLRVLTSDCDSPSSAVAWPLSVPLSLKIASDSVSHTLYTGFSLLVSFLREPLDADSLSHNPVSLDFAQYSEQHSWLYPSACIISATLLSTELY